MKSDEEADAKGEHRFGHRFPSLSNPAPSPVTDPISSLRATNDGAISGTTTTTPAPRRRKPIRDLTAVADALSERDWHILRTVADHRFLTVSHIHALHFADHTPASGLRIAQRTLARLRRERVLAAMDRRVGGIRAGSSGLVHYVDVTGDRLLRAESGKKARQRRYEPTTRFLDHQLAIADAHVALAESDRQAGMELLRCDLEPTNWRRYLGLGGAQLIVKPDLYVETAPTRGSEYVDAWFVEIDLGNESIPTLLRKCRDYEAYRRTGTEQTNFDGAFPLVVLSMTAKTEAKAERRRTALRAAIAADRTLKAELFRIVAPDQLIALIQKGGDQ